MNVEPFGSVSCQWLHSFQFYLAVSCEADAGPDWAAFACLGEGAVGRHESLDHRRDQFGRLGRRRRTSATRHNFGLALGIPEERRRQFDRELDGLIV